MTMEDVIGRLKAYEERVGGNEEENAEQVLLTQGEWKEKKKSGNKSKIKCFNCQGIGHYASECPKMVKCYNCQRIGHYAFDRGSKKRDDQAHLIEQSDEDEPAFL